MARVCVSWARERAEGRMAPGPRSAPLGLVEAPRQMPRAATGRPLRPLFLRHPPPPRSLSAVLPPPPPPPARQLPRIAPSQEFDQTTECSITVHDIPFQVWIPSAYQVPPVPLRPALPPPGAAPAVPVKLHRDRAGAAPGQGGHPRPLPAAQPSPVPSPAAAAGSVDV